MNALRFTATQRQTQTASPRLQHAVRLLQMSSMEFAALVRSALDSNPFLEAEDGADAAQEVMVDDAHASTTNGPNTIRPRPIRRARTAISGKADRQQAAPAQTTTISQP